MWYQVGEAGGQSNMGLEQVNCLRSGKLQLIMPDTPQLNSSVPLSHYVQTPLVPIFPAQQQPKFTQNNSNYQQHPTGGNGGRPYPNKRRYSSYGNSSGGGSFNNSNAMSSSPGSGGVRPQHMRMRLDSRSPQHPQQQPMHGGNGYKHNLMGLPMENTENYYKTTLCTQFMNSGQCRYGISCRFAHGDQELRRGVVGGGLKPADPLVNEKYKTTLCKSYTVTGDCKYGMQCLFAHGNHELRASPFANSNGAMQHQQQNGARGYHHNHR